MLTRVVFFFDLYRLTLPAYNLTNYHIPLLKQPPVTPIAILHVMLAFDIPFDEFHVCVGLIHHINHTIIGLARFLFFYSSIRLIDKIGITHISIIIIVIIRVRFLNFNRFFSDLPEACFLKILKSAF